MTSHRKRPVPSSELTTFMISKALYLRWWVAAEKKMKETSVVFDSQLARDERNILQRKLLHVLKSGSVHPLHDIGCPISNPKCCAVKPSF